MSNALIWTIWTVVMVGLAYITLVVDWGPYKVAVFIAAAVLVSAGAILFQGSAQASERR